MRYLSVILSVVFIGLVSLGAALVAHQYFQGQELEKARGRLSLYRASVNAELDRFSHLTHILANDPFVVSSLLNGNTTIVDSRFEDFANQSGLDAIYLINPQGLTIAASNHALPSSFIGEDYSFRPYFQDALAGKQGRFYAIGATTGQPGYFIADPVLATGGRVLGVVVIKINFGALEDSWRSSGETVFMANEDGVILLASDRDYLYRTTEPLSASQRNVILFSRQFPNQPLEPLGWSLSGNTAKLSGRDWLHLSANAAPHNWQIHYFMADERSSALAWLTAAAVVIILGSILIAFQIQRTRRIGTALRRSEEEEAKLRLANERLAQEIVDRKTAERRLSRTQNELERASRLAALGRLAASVTHELGQPIAAMRNHVAAAELGPSGPSRFTGSIGGLIDRMEGITRQLKFFSRSDADDFAEFDLVAAMDASLVLVAPNIDGTATVINFDRPDGPTPIRGSKLRVEQVMTNVLRNAIDAVEDTDHPTVTIRIGSDPSPWFEVQDNGHGLGDATLADLQEPFVTTRESGRGMGLGLAISSGIVKDHEGTMQASNVDSGGALFRVTFPAPNANERGDA